MLNTVVSPLLLFITVAGSPCSSVHPIPEIVWVKFSLDDQIRKEEKEVKTNRWCGCCPFPSLLEDLERKKSSISLKRYTQDFSARSLSLSHSFRPHSLTSEKDEFSQGDAWRTLSAQGSPSAVFTCTTNRMELPTQWSIAGTKWWKKND